MYSILINKQISPFIYIDLTMDPSTLDVNIHPSKNEVRFLHSDPIIVAIVQSIERVLLQKSAKQTTTTTTQLTFHLVASSQKQSLPMKWIFPLFASLDTHHDYIESSNHDTILIHRRRSTIGNESKTKENSIFKYKCGEIEFSFSSIEHSPNIKSRSKIR